MIKPKIVIHNTETNEIIEREMTNEEFQIWDADKNAYEARQTEAKVKKAAAEAKLAALGLTAADLRALGL